VWVQLRAPGHHQPALVRPRVIVVSYDTLTRSDKQIKELKPKMVVLDEVRVACVRGQRPWAAAH
jgi:hypothetical protein